MSIVSEETARRIADSLERIERSLEAMKLPPNKDYVRGSDLPLVGCAYCGGPHPSASCGKGGL
jgi:hypothetical protein